MKVPLKNLRIIYRPHPQIRHLPKINIKNISPNDPQLFKINERL